VHIIDRHSIDWDRVGKHTVNGDKVSRYGLTECRDGLSKRSTCKCNVGAVDEHVSSGITVVHCDRAGIVRVRVNRSGVPGLELGMMLVGTVLARLGATSPGSGSTGKTAAGLIGMELVGMVLAGLDATGVVLVNMV